MVLSALAAQAIVACSRRALCVLKLRPDFGKAPEVARSSYRKTALVLSPDLVSTAACLFLNNSLRWVIIIMKNHNEDGKRG